MSLPFMVHTDHPFDNDALVNEVDRLFLRTRKTLNSWLNVEQLGFGPSYADKGRAVLPPGKLRDLGSWMHYHLWSTVDIVPNTAYVQTGGPVKAHRDPLTDLYFTTIAYFGDFTGGHVVVQHEGKDHRIPVYPGACIALRCTNHSKQGPLHWTLPHEGYRCTLILNHSVKT